MKDRRHLWIAHIVPTIMLLIAFDSANPYGFYVLLRFVCCAAFVLLAVNFLNSYAHPAWIWAYGFSAVLYNPILRIPLDRESWEVANVCVLILLGVSMVRLIRNKEVAP